MKNSIWLVLITMVFFSCSSEPDNQFTIKADMEDVSDGWVVLTRVIDGDLKPVDSVKAVDGKFTFTGTIDTPEMYYLDFKENKTFHRFFVEPGTITITGDLQTPEFEGADAQVVFDRFNEEMRQFDQRGTDLTQRYREAQEANDQETLGRVEEDFRELEKEQTAYIINFAARNPASVASPYIIVSNAYVFNLEELEQALDSFDASISGSKYVQQLSDQVDKLRKVAIGQPAPVFTQKNEDGEPVSLSDFRGQYLLIDFWASWCQPCRAENPNLVEAYNKYKDQGFEILGVSLDRKKDSWLKAIENDNLTWPQVSDLQYWNNEASDLYGVSSIPANFLLDPEGVIIAKNLRGEKLDEKLEEILGK